jgi:FG-GAP-like repeat/Bacterial Ig domain
MSRTFSLFVLAGYLIAIFIGAAAAQTPTPTPSQVTFTNQLFITGPAPAGVVSGDFNRDGHPDLAVTDSTANRVTILLGQGGGNFTFGTDINTNVGPRQIATADFNQDGILDLAVSNTNASTVTILLGNGDGTFRRGNAVQLGAGNTSMAVAAADFDRSGTPQLAVVQCDFNDKCGLNIYKSNAAGTFTLTQSVPAGPFNLGEGSFSYGMIAVADFNLDGLPDVAVANVGQVFIFTDTANGTLQLKTTLTPPSGGTIVGFAVGALDGNNTPDVVVRTLDSTGFGSLPNSETIYVNDGTAAFTVKSTISACCLLNGAGFVATGDLNGDLLNDVMSVSQGSNNPGVQYSLGAGDGTFGAPQSVFLSAAGDGPLVVAGAGEASMLVRDLDGDSRHDLVVTSIGANGSGVGTWIFHNVDAATNCATPSSAAVNVNICSPADNATVPASFVVSASGNAPSGIKRLEIWVDGTKRAETLSDQFRGTITLTPGSHRLTVVGVDQFDALFKKPIMLNVL